MQPESDRKEPLATAESEEFEADDWTTFGGGTGGFGGGTGGLDPRMILDLVSSLETEKVHPVLIFGTHGSGKTVMILSLLHYARQNIRANMSISLGNPVFPPNFPFANERHRDAEQFYHDLTVEFANRERPPGTKKIVPFFVPIDIEVDGRRFRFAFLEGNGEWYEKDDVSYRQFKDEIVGILGSFTAPVSVVFVAPTVAPTRDENAPQDRRGRDYSHECLAHCVAQYAQRRIATSRDNLLLLVSKWDALHEPGRTYRHFSDASVADVLREIEGWQFIWQAFGNLAGPRRAILPYSAAWINAAGFILRDERYQPIFDKFNRTLWNWLYGNVTEATSDQVPPVRKVLYKDVRLPPQKPPGLYERLTRMVLRTGPGNSVEGR